MSNNDLYCSRCESHHHPAAECMADGVKEEDVIDTLNKQLNLQAETIVRLNRELQEAKQIIAKYESGELEA